MNDLSWIPRPDDGPIAAYNALVKAGDLRPDPVQADVVAHLETLQKALFDHHCAGDRGQGLFSRLFKKTSRPPNGLYLWGGVGRGKSMLMDLFFATAPIQHKRRVHFHEFMLDVHARLNEWRGLSPMERKQRGGDARSDDPIPPVAASLAREACLLCFDEFHVTDVADAMILGRLFTEFLAHGLVIVATSNRPPDDLYKDGLNRQLFLPFIDLLKSRFDIIGLNGPTDYRLERMRGMDTWLVPVNAETTEALSRDFFRLTDRDVDNERDVPSDKIEAQGREIFVPKACKGVAVFSFKRLCANPLGAADYLAIAHRYHTVIVVAVPQMGPAQRNEAKRFTTLVDVLYEQNVKLLASAQAQPQDLYKNGSESFEFERTVSRLLEMQSQDYLKRGHGVR
ncbi:cell division protein ZapE [Iodidimonas muriae]|uniref:Cell division protein ZapE n=1 Tax=Iodidimonas muriae TaxID=261467 RepID=A0ABQ2LEC7_9PROT|nr:cell division protein ZapE [Iodidimonas muriae]GER07884.1 cell division protein ZapE [Kordiimonadales bacterium JCM 17843]GGO12030.1 cell division protein ZapE [Iodidimonas muriae]